MGLDTKIMIERWESSIRKSEREKVFRKIEYEVDRVEVCPRLGRGLFVRKHEIEKAINKVANALDKKEVDKNVRKSAHAGSSSHTA